MNTLLKTCVLLCAVFSITIAIADDDDAQPTQKIPHVAGQTVITLNTKAQQLSGLQTIIIKPASYHAEFTAYGKVLGSVDIWKNH